MISSLYTLDSFIHPFKHSFSDLYFILHFQLLRFEVKWVSIWHLSLQIMGSIQRNHTMVLSYWKKKRWIQWFDGTILGWSGDWRHPYNSREENVKDWKTMATILAVQTDLEVTSIASKGKVVAPLVPVNCSSTGKSRRSILFKAIFC